MSRIILLVALCAFAVSGHYPKCFLPLSRGTSCSDPPSQRYHFDPKLNQCHAFQYKGCAGTLNNYKTLKDCEDTCALDPSNIIQCPLHTRTIFDSKNNNQCSKNSKSGEGCESPDAYCTHFASMSLCCNRTVVLGYQSDKSSTCPNGKARWQIDGSAVLAKSCEAVACPTGYTCQNGNFFSYCCEN